MSCWVADIASIGLGRWENICTTGNASPQPTGVVSQISGFNANVRIFQCYNPLLALEIAFHDSELVSWERQRQLIYESLQKAKSVTAELPSELSLNYPQQFSELSSPSIISGWPLSFGAGMTNRDQERRKIQYARCGTPCTNRSYRAIDEAGTRFGNQGSSMFAEKRTRNPHRAQRRQFRTSTSLDLMDCILTRRK